MRCPCNGSARSTRYPGDQRLRARVLDAFGPDRVMFGSDWPVCTLAADYATVFDTAHALIHELAAHEQADVLGGTALRAYRLHLP
ncbi:amidohydrolase family protein [Streptomyces sp. NPDC059153]|uniref:amidohydrolase family protein n=1 Tax=unclassified Streptomyces TaxID=2593676 RepID=UPI0036B02974